MKRRLKYLFKIKTAKEKILKYNLLKIQKLLEMINRMRIQKLILINNNYKLILNKDMKILI